MVTAASTLTIAQIAIPAASLAQSRSFYKDTIGLSHLFDAPNISAFDLGGVRLILTERPDYRAPIEAGILYYLRTDDIEGRYRDWTEAGARDGGAPHCVANLDEREIWIAFVYDPTGNMIGLIEERGSGQ